MTFAVDSAACRTVVPKGHKAARGYRVWKDKHLGERYGTAKKGGPKIEDEGLRILQTKVQGDETPKRIHTRTADVHRPLMAVCDLVDKGHAVLFDAGGSYAWNKKTGVTTPFVRVGKGWDLTFDLEAPEAANEISKKLIAEMRQSQLQAAQPQLELKLNNKFEVLVEHEK